MACSERCVEKARIPICVKIDGRIGVRALIVLMIEFTHVWVAKPDAYDQLVTITDKVLIEKQEDQTLV